MNKQIILLLTLMFSIMSISFISAIPPEPMAFYGNVTYTNGTAIPNGYYLIAKIGTTISGECEIISSLYGQGSTTCIVLTHLTTNPRIDFYLGNYKVGESTFQGKEIVKLNFKIDVLPPRNLSSVSNGICEPLKGECSYNILDCDNSITKACLNNSVCDSAIGEDYLNAPNDCISCGDGSCNNGETCSTCSSDCGVCASSGGSGGSSGGGGGGGGGGSSPKKIIVLNTTTNSTVNQTNTSPQINIGGASQDNNEPTTTSTTKKPFFSFLTGWAVSDEEGTIKPWVVVVLFVIILLVVGGILFSLLRKNKLSNKHKSK